MERVLIQIPVAMKRKFDALKAQGYTASGYIRALLERELNEKEGPIMGVKLRERIGKGWYVLIDWKGKRKAKAFGKDEKSTQLFAQKMAYRLQEGEHIGASVSLDDSPKNSKTMPTVKEYLIKWQETYAKPNCNPGLCQGYRTGPDSAIWAFTFE
jgi:predicted DNA-binding protein